MSIAQIAPLVRGAYLDRLGVPVAVTRVAGDDEPGYKLDVAPVEGLQNVLKSLGNTTAKVTLITVKDDNSDLAAAVAAAPS